MSDDKISIPKLRIKAFKDPVFALIKPDNEDEITIHKRDVHNSINELFEIVINEDTTNLNYVFFLWDADNVESIGVALNTSNLPQFQVEPLIRDAFRTTLIHRMVAAMLPTEDTE